MSASNMTPDRVRWLVAVSIFAVFAACSSKPKRDCPEFDEAQTYFDQLIAATLDPEFRDPVFAEAAARFEAIPSDCRRYGQARATARTIRLGQRKGAHPPPTQPVVVDETFSLEAGLDLEKGVPDGILCSIKHSPTGGKARTVRILCVNRPTVEEALDACVEWGEARDYAHPAILKSFCECRRVKLMSRRHCPVHQPYR